MPLQLNEDTVWDYYHTAMTMGQNGIDWNEVLLGACKRSCEDMTTEQLREYWSTHFIIPPQMLVMIVEVDLRCCVALHRYNLTVATEEAACWSTQDPNSPFAEESEENESKLCAGDYIQVPQHSQWLIDSGASNHFTNMKHLLSDYRDCPDERILTGNRYIIAKGIGNVTIYSSLGLRTIYDVFYIPALSGKNNLLSIPQIVRKGCKITMSKSSGCKIYSDDKETTLLLQGSFTGKGFMLDMSVCHTTTQLAKMDLRTIAASHQPILLPSHLKDEGRIAMLAGLEDIQPIEIWHIRLGHLNQVAIQQLSTNATGLIIGPARPQTITMKCESCLREAQHKNISYQRGLGARKKLEHVWTDIKGPLLDKDVYGFKFFCTFICEHTRWTAEYPLLEKGHVFGAYKLFEARFERLAGERILHLHIDGGPEYLTNDFRSHLCNKGVALCVTQPYSPEMNSIAERAMRTIIEHASAMLWNANLPIGFWSQAVETSVYLMNRSPHTALAGKTPFEAWYGNKPNLGHLRVFGCRAAAHVPDELRTKTD